VSTFCSAPFVHKFISNSGKRYLCCAASRDSNVEVEWNSDEMKIIRRKMLNDEYVDACKECYKVEEAGSTSHRHIMNRFTDFTPDIEKGNETGKPLTFDLRLNNICNLTCRMCGSYSSTQIDKIVRRNPELHKYDAGTVIMPPKSQYDLSEAREVRLLGGEPMLQPEAYEILENLDPDVTVFITSNLTNLNPRFMELIKKFNDISFVWSIDGTEKTYEYIRHPAKWYKIVENYNRFKSEFPNVEARTQVTVSIYNVFDFWKVSNYFEGNVDYGYVESPKEMDPSDLPDNWREYALDEFYENYKGYDDWKESKLGYVINRLENGKHNPELIDHIKKRTELYDTAYGKSIYDYIPIFKEVFA